MQNLYHQRYLLLQLEVTKTTNLAIGSDGNSLRLALEVRKALNDVKIYRTIGLVYACCSALGNAVSGLGSSPGT